MLSAAVAPGAAQAAMPSHGSDGGSIQPAVAPDGVGDADECQDGGDGGELQSPGGSVAAGEDEATGCGVPSMVAPAAAPTLTAPSPPPAPVVGGTTGTPTGQATSQVGAPKVISAVFTATINPEGLPTTMHFEYTVDSGGTAAITYSARTPEQFVGSDFSDHTVTATVAGLLPNTLYHLRAVAVNAAGVTAGSDTTFKTPANSLPPPVLGKSVNATPVTGLVMVLLPGAGHVARRAAFTPLTNARQLPVGTIFDTKRGIVRVTSATATPGKLQSGDFSAGLFKVLQKRRERGLTELRLVRKSSAVRACPKPDEAETAARRALPRTVLALLRASVKGRFRTRGRYSSATVRGTMWTTSDRCDGTLTTVQRGVVVVVDSRRHTRIVLRAGGSYLAKTP